MKPMKMLVKRMKMLMKQMSMSMKSMMKQEKSGKHVKQEENENSNTMNSRFSFLNSVRMKLIGLFLIPVAFIIALGVITYQKSHADIMESYEKSSATTLEMMSNYFTLGFETVSAKSNQFLSNDVIKNYYSGIYDDDAIASVEQYKLIGNLVASNIVNDSVVQDIYMFANYGNGTSSRGILPEDMYEIFKQSEEGKTFIESKKRFMWNGYHHYFDENSQLQKNVEYGLALTYYLYGSNGKKIGLIVIDIKKDFLTKAMEETNYEKGSIVGVITKDGKEILTGDYPEEFSFASTDFYNKYLPADEGTGVVIKKQEDNKEEEQVNTTYVSYKGKSYLYIYQYLKDQDATVCALIPKDMILKQTDEVKSITITVVILACLIAIMVGSMFATSISRTIHSTNDVLLKTAKGDLTVRATLKRKDEFSHLANGINSMIGGMKDLIIKTMKVSSDVSGNADEVSKTSAILLLATEEITKSVEEIEQGASLQAYDAQECLNQMSTLSDHIGVVSEKAGNIGEIANMTLNIVKEGSVVVDDLSDKAKKTVNITQVVIDDIEKLEKKSLAVNNIISSINYISEQTNLLSLNATIEAARAGEYGRGFAVVADEIRKLAAQSQKAASQIGDIIVEIVDQTKETVKTARRAEDIVASQEVTLKSTVAVFSNINNHVEKLSVNLNQILGGIKEIEQAKEDALKAVSSITSTTQQTAAATGELGATAVNQMNSVEALNNAALRLNDAVKNLEETVAVFITE